MKKPTINTLLNIDLSKKFNRFVSGSTHRGYFLDEAGREHYQLLAYISKRQKKGAVVCDLGTYKGLSALALAYNKHVEVHTYDPSDIALYKRIPEEVDNITFHEMKAQDDIDFIAKADFIFLDVDPHDGDQEIEIVELLIKKGYEGMILCDDIHLNENMKRFWKWCENCDNISTYDWTDLGHSTGTGCIVLS